VKVLDFGISKAVSLNKTDGHSLTASGVLMGSPAYMSPEQVRSSKDVDGRSDVWSLGVILYELLSGASPFAGETLGDTFAKIVTEPPPPLGARRPDLSPKLVAVIEACLERRLEARVQNVGELANRLLPFAPPDAVTSVDRIRRISGISSSGTITAPEGTIAAPETMGGGHGLGTERPWMRSGTESGTPRRSRLWPVALGAAAALVAVVGATLAFWPKPQPPVHQAASTATPAPEAPPAPPASTPASTPHAVDVAPPAPSPDVDRSLDAGNRAPPPQANEIAQVPAQGGPVHGPTHAAGPSGAPRTAASHDVPRTTPKSSATASAPGTAPSDDYDHF
jgi:serine/threonine-protein kinase